MRNRNKPFKKFSNRGNNNNSTNRSQTKAKGLTSALGSHVFTTGKSNSMDTLKTSWAVLGVHVGSILGEDLANELLSGKETVIKKPEYTQEQKDQHADSETKRKARQERVKTALERKLTSKEAIVTKGEGRHATEDEKAAGIDAAIEVAQLTGEIEELQDQTDQDIPIQLIGEAKKVWDTSWKLYEERQSKLESGRGKAFNKIKGQCEKNLLEAMKAHSDHDTVMASGKPLLLKALIEKTILNQAQDTYPFATVYNQTVSLHGFQQNNLSDDEWHIHLGTRAEVAMSAGVSLTNPTLLDYVSQEVHKKKYSELTDDEKALIEADTTERYLAYVMLRQSGSQHKALKSELTTDCLKAHMSEQGHQIYPKTRTHVLKFLQTYSKTLPPTDVPVSLGGSFAQRGGRTGNGGKGKGGKGNKHCDKDYWKERFCHGCQKKGHPKWACPGKSGDTKDDDNKSTSSKASRAEQISKLEKQVKKASKVYTTVQTQLKEIKECNSSISDSDSESEDEGGHSFFNVHKDISVPMSQAHLLAQQLHNIELSCLDSTTNSR